MRVRVIMLDVSAQVPVVCKDEHTYRWYHVCVVNRDAAPRFEHLASLP